MQLQGEDSTKKGKKYFGGGDGSKSVRERGEGVKNLACKEDHASLLSAGPPGKKVRV